MKNIQFNPIGIIHSPFKEPRGTPIQPGGGKRFEGTVEVFSEFKKGLKDLEGFSHILLLYHLHLSEGKKTALQVQPFMDDEYRGLFATRAPNRPNQIGLSVVRLTKIEDNILFVKDLDIIEGTPLLDIKPYVAEFDRREDIRIGWLENNVDKLPRSKDDGRFSE